MMKRAFTLIEVNLAMLIMAGGILSIVGLYSFGFRENRQSREDVAAAAYADEVISPLVMAISATNLVWSKFKDEFKYPSEKGWADYFDQSTGLVKSDPHAKATSVFSATISKIKRAVGSGSLEVSGWPSQPSQPKMSAGLVVMHERDSAVVTIAFRAVQSDKFGTLLSMPLFFTEVRFQGIQDELKENE